MITASYLRSILSYDKETGIFTWKHRTDVRPEWNTRFSGRLAGCIDAAGYYKISINGTRYYSHRLAYTYTTGLVPQQVDHKNGVRSDNRWSNLRAANNSTNSKNQKKRSTNTSGVNGVYWCKRRSLWYVKVGWNGKNLHGGYFETKEAASKARFDLDKKIGYFESHGKEKGA